MEVKIKEEKIAVGISFEKAELLKRKLIELEIMDPFFRTVREKNMVFFPIKGEDKLEELKREFPEISIERKEMIAKRKLLKRHQLISEIKKDLLFHKMPLRYLVLGDSAILELEDDQEIEKKMIELVKLENKKVNKVFKIKNLGLLLKNYAPLQIYGEKVERIIRERGELKFLIKIGKNFLDPRLDFERNKVLNSIKKDERICEIFAGYNMLCIEIAKKIGMDVIAIEEDIELYDCLEESMKLNDIVGKIKPVLCNPINNLPKFLTRNFDRVIAWDHIRNNSAFNLIKNLVADKGKVNMLIVSNEPSPHEDIQIKIEKNFEGFEISHVKTLLRISVMEYLVSLELKKLF